MRGLNLLREPPSRLKAIINAGSPGTFEDQATVVGNDEQVVANNEQVVAENEIRIDPTRPYGGLMEPDRPNAPGYSTGFETTQRNTAKAQSIGNLLALLANTAGLSMGANVGRSSPKPLEPYLQSILDKRERYEAELKQFKQTDFLNELRLAGERNRRAEKEVEFTEDVRRFDVGTGQKQQTFDLDKAYKEHLVANNLEDNKLNRDKFNEDIRRFDLGLPLEKRKLDIEQSKIYAARNKPFLQVRVDGQDINLSEGQYRDYLEKALRASGDKEEADIKAILAQYAHQPTEEYKNIVQRYLMDEAEKEKEAARNRVVKKKYPGSGLPGTKKVGPKESARDI